MKKGRLLLLLLLTWSCSLSAQHRGVIFNEVLTAWRHLPGDTARFGGSDWIELYNPGARAVQLLGMRIALDGVRHMIDAPLSIGARQHLVLWCDGREELGADHLRFQLPVAGGGLALFAADGITLLDSLRIPALSADRSVGRTPDGATQWAVFVDPSPGAPNPAQGLDTARTPSPIVRVAAGFHPAPFTLPLEVTPADVRYTLDGTAPGPGSPEWNTALRIDSTCTLRAWAFSPGRPPSAELCVPYVIGIAAGPAIHISMAPDDLWSDSTGLNTHGRFGNHSRTGRDWERPTHVIFTGIPDSAWATTNTMAAGIRISGSGSRGLAKRSFKLYARDAYESDAAGFHFAGTPACDEAMLRADASPHAFLRNLLIETIVQQHGLAVDVQPSTAWPLYLNGRYWGQYRWMPPKDAQWLKTIARTESVDVLEGPGLRLLSGDSTGLHKALTWLTVQGPVDSIDAVIDTESLIDLACLDLFTGRADHDLNVRCWRPRHNDRPGRWRWVVFDMDLWAPVDDASLPRIATADPGSAPYLAELLAHAVLRERLHARALALAATAFDPDQLEQLADSLYTAHAAGITFDHERWQGEMPTPHPLEVREELLRFVSERTAHFLEQVEGAMRSAAVSSQVSAVKPITDGPASSGGVPEDRALRTNN